MQEQDIKEAVAATIKVALTKPTYITDEEWSRMCRSLAIDIHGLYSEQTTATGGEMQPSRGG